LSESLAYELDSFGIRMVIIEPGFVKTNISNAMVIAQKTQDPNSPYSQMMQKIGATSSKMANNASPVHLA
jgi:NAD(P)-dependent dehydrogenase (short-subunit alcohol dehydrogenase family)